MRFNGTVWYKKPVDVSKGFETDFIFHICEGTSHPDGRDDGGYPGADGISLIIHKDDES